MGQIIQGPGDIFGANVRQALFAVSGDGRNRGGSRKDLACPIVTSGAIDGARPDDNCPKALFQVFKYHVFTFFFTSSIIVPGVPWAVFNKGSAPVISINTGGSDVDEALGPGLDGQSRDGFDAFNVGRI